MVLDFWGYWYGPCVVNMPRSMALQHKFEGRRWPSLHSTTGRCSHARSPTKRSPQFASGSGTDVTCPFRYNLTVRPREKSADLNPLGTGTTIKRYCITGLPTVFVIDQDGIMVRAVGFYEHDRLESLVCQLIERPKAR